MESVQERTPGRGNQSSKPESGPDEHVLAPLDDLLHYVKDYAREQPEVMMLTCLGIGFILGWKLKPW